MAAQSFLRLKGRTSYFRRKIPADLVGRLASSEICLKLGVVDRNLAIRLARRLATSVDAFFVAARGNPMLSSADLAEVLQSARAEWDVALAPLPSLVLSPRQQARNYAKLAAGILERDNAGHVVIDETFLAKHCTAAGVPAPTDPSAQRFASHAMATSMAGYWFGAAAEVARRHGLHRGLFALPAADWDERSKQLLDAYGATAMEQSEAEPPEAQASGTPPPAALEPKQEGADTEPATRTDAAGKSREDKVGKFESEAGATFSTQALYLVRERITAKQVSEAATDNIAASLRLWLQICGDDDIRAYEPRHMGEFRTVLLELPFKYWKSRAEQRKPILQVISERATKDPHYKRVIPDTVNKHISNINSVFQYAQKLRIVDRAHGDFAEDLYLETGARVSGLEENQQRPGYTPKQITHFFSHPVYTGRRSLYFYNQPGKMIFRDALYWVPLLAAYQLMRREEICQLKVKHVREVGGIWFIDLMHHEIRVKRSRSRRRVPFHDDILALGFIEARVAGRNPEELLFPELRPTRRGSFSDGLGKRVGRMVDELGIQLVRVDSSTVDGALHPFRHAGVTQLMNVHKINHGLLDGLTGHSSTERKTERTRYTDEIYLSTLRETINLLKLPIDVEEMNARFERFGQPYDLAVSRSPRGLGGE